MFKKISYSSILILFFFVSCSSLPGPFEKDALSEMEIEEILKEKNLETIHSLIDEGAPSKALQYILSAPEDQSEYEDVRSLYPLALSKMEESYRQALEEKDYRKAISIYDSFKAIGEDSYIDEVSLKELSFKYVLSLFDQGEDGAAVAVFYNYLDFDDLDEESLVELEQKLIKAEIRGPLQNLFDYYVKKSMNADPQTIRFLSGKPNFQDMTAGTVTVWVNRGIRIENGIGFPDRGIGSGFFIDARGHILTNYHVISSEVDPEYEGYSRLFIKLSDDSEERIPAKVIGWDKELDVALIKCEVDPQYIFSFARDYDPAPGDKIYAIGSPGGLKNTLTSGSVSTLNRQLQSIGDTLQIDVPINPGNSGGPLLHPSGDVIGLVFAGIEQFEGVNFAIPVSDVKDILADLYTGGEVIHSWLGAALFERSGKLEVLYVTPGSPARQIGLKQGDVIESVDGKKYQKITELQRFFLKKDTGTLVRIEWMTGEGNRSAVASLDQRPENPMKEALDRDAFDNLLVPLFGMDAERVRGTGNKNVLYNLLKVYPGTTADEAGLAAGDSVLLRKWENPEKSNILLMQILMKSRKAGFIESAVQIGTYLNKGFFI
ncbi:S1C family serine protease [Spirochaeta isovalerica]|uniref:S1-C subfamily serine protease n=1 Tax=Spirochaeta isovalerica TaxID=150 RepID=A0A841R570_9SPIO|nr:trypsin-like peptidase domain-containing protein [Spirochaeta isovalerica]MBB6479015.1 S1-C subfamily serine protease [Spirochaeta isovalerica]